MAAVCLRVLNTLDIHRCRVLAYPDVLCDSSEYRALRAVAITLLVV